MAKHGINAKKWFYGFRNNLSARADHVRRVLAGCASEQWLNAELFAHISSVVPEGMYAYPEHRKRDVSVFSYRSGDKARNDLTEAIIETKLVYATYSEEKVGTYTTRLCEQMIDVARNVAREQEEPCQVFGLMVGVWVEWPNRFYKRRTRRTLGLFRRTAGGIVRDRARKYRVRAAKEALESIVPIGTIRNGREAVEVALVGQYLLLES